MRTRQRLRSAETAAGKRRMTPEDREEILRLHLTGEHSYSKIAKQFGVSRNTIAGLLYRMRTINPELRRPTQALAPVEKPAVQANPKPAPKPRPSGWRSPSAAKPIVFGTQQKRPPTQSRRTLIAELLKEAKQTPEKYKATTVVGWIAELTPHQCRWIEGEVDNGGLTCCCNERKKPTTQAEIERAAQFPYCPRHQYIAICGQDAFDSAQSAAQR